MNILLINPPTARSNPKGIFPRSLNPFPPIGLAYLAATVRQEGFRVEILDCPARNLSIADIERKIEASRPDLIGVTTYTHTLAAVFQLGEICRRTAPDAVLVLGGPHMATYPEETLLKSRYRIGVIGEGETTFLELVQRLREGGSLDDIDGTVVKKGAQVIRNKPCRRIKDLDSIPFPARDLLPNHVYQTTLAAKPFSYMITSRGCPYNCTFCDKGLWGRLHTRRSPESTVTEMAECRDRYKIKCLYVYDETFTLNRDWVFETCDLIRERCPGLRWVISTRVDLLNREILEQLKKAGCYQVRLGVESGDQEILRAMKKGITLEQVNYVFRTCRELGIETYAYFMLGYPGETPQTVEKTINYALELAPDWVNFNIVQIKPGTELFQIASESGYVPVDYWHQFIDGIGDVKEPYCTSDDISEEFLQKSIKSANRRFYFRLRFFIRLITSRPSPATLARLFRGFMGRYWQYFIGRYRNVLD
ncbi:B12-binding domain-containing radical SAM protein [candidate division KSB1 bacterium]